MNCSIRSGVALFATLLLPQLGASALAKGCKLARLAELPVTMDDLRPTVTAKINGTDVLFALDSGAFWSTLTPATAAQFKLHLDRGRFPGLYFEGVGGRVDAAITNVADFSVFNVILHHVDFIVGGSEPGQGTVGLLGQNILRIADVEYDLAHGVIRFFRPEDCEHTNLAYWTRSDRQPYSLMDIAWATPESPHTTGTAHLNGAKIRVTFDSGAPVTMVGLRAAQRAGVKPGGAGVTPGGFTTGLGRSGVQTWIATFPNLKIGDEEVHNARLHFGDLGSFTDMLLGADFFLSHRIYVASSQHKLYFTYNGGPVFNLTSPPSTGAANPPSAAPSASPVPTPAAPSPAPAAPAVPTNMSSAARSGGHTEAGAAKQPGTKEPGTPKEPDAPKDAGGFARRGAAFAARHDFEHALADLTRACELAPDEPAYFYQRGAVRMANNQPNLARRDIDRALELKPDYVEALVSRAEFRIADHEPQGAVADLDAADRAAAQEADVRLRLARLYEITEDWPQALAQYDLWMAVHAQDARAVQALNGRCWVRALWGQELDRALKDCNAALQMYPHSAPLLDTRGLVFLRSGKLGKAIADYDAALRANPRIAWSLYGRGVARLRKGMTAEGQADLAAAATLAPELAERARRLGIVP